MCASGLVFAFLRIGGFSTIGPDPASPGPVSNSLRRGHHSLPLESAQPAQRRAEGVQIGRSADPAKTEICSTLTPDESAWRGGLPKKRRILSRVRHILHEANIQGIQRVAQFLRLFDLSQLNPFLSIFSHVGFRALLFKARPTRPPTHPPPPPPSRQDFSPEMERQLGLCMARAPAGGGRPSHWIAPPLLSWAKPGKPGISFKTGVWLLRGRLAEWNQNRFGRVQ